MMSHAWDGNAERAASEFVDVTRPSDYRCTTGTCRCLVTWNKGWTIQKGGNTTTIPRHFKVRLGDNHVSGCRYAVAVQLQLLADLSDPIETAAKPILRKNGKFRIRLNIVADGARRPPQPSTQTGSQSSFKFGRDYVHRARKAMPYIRSAAGVAKIYVALPQFERDQYKQGVVFEDAGRDVPWEDFVYEPSDYARLLDRLTRLGSRTLERPIALVVTCATQPGPYVTSKGQNGLRFWSPRIQLDANTSLALTFYTATPAIFKRVKRGDTYVIVGLQTWRLADLVKNGQTSKVIGVMLHYRSQVSKL